MSVDRGVASSPTPKLRRRKMSVTGHDRRSRSASNMAACPSAAAIRPAQRRLCPPNRPRAPCDGGQPRANTDRRHLFMLCAAHDCAISLAEAGVPIIGAPRRSPSTSANWGSALDVDVQRNLNGVIELKAEVPGCAFGPLLTDCRPDIEKVSSHRVPLRSAVALQLSTN